MARFDKTNGIGVHRAKTAVAWADNQKDIAIACGLDANGSLVRGVGVAEVGFVGVVVVTKKKNIGDILDYLNDGELVEFPTKAAPGSPGTRWVADTVTGVISNAAPDATHVRIGHTVEAGRLVVNLPA